MYSFFFDQDFVTDGSGSQTWDGVYFQKIALFISSIYLWVKEHGNAYLRPLTSLISSIWISWISTNLSHW
jgi:hypothetical protein